MSGEDKILYIGIAALVIGAVVLYKKKPSGKSDEDLSIIRQSCVNAGREKNIPTENMDSFVEDCTKHLIESEKKEGQEAPKHNSPDQSEIDSLKKAK